MSRLGETSLGEAYGLGASHVPTGTFPEIGFVDGAQIYYMVLAQGADGLLEGVADALMGALARRVRSCLRSPAGAPDDVVGTMCMGPMASGVAGVIYGGSGAGDPVIRGRLLFLIFNALLNPGYRLYSEVGNRMEWICAPGLAPGDERGYSVTPGEVASRGVFQAFAGAVSRPYDVARAAAYRYGSRSGAGLWAPNAPLSGFLLGDGPAGAYPNYTPPTHQEDEIIGVQIGILDGPVMDDVEAALRLSGLTEEEVEMLCRRWVAATLSDTPWVYYSRQGPPGARGYALLAFEAEGEASGVPDRFELLFFDGRLSRVFTVRQALGAAAGFRT